MAAIYVRLPQTDIDALRDLAQRELRDPRDQAAILIREGLRRGGLPRDKPPRPRTPPRVY
jgi:hypothetical protein